MKSRLPVSFRKLGLSLVSPRVIYPAAMIVLGAIIAAILIGWLVSREKTEKLVLYSGQEGGTYKPLAEEIAKLIERKNPQIRIEVQESDGSLANLRRIAGGESGNRLAIVQNDVQIPADLTPQQAGTVRSLLPLHQDVLHFLVPEESQIHSVADLRGKSVAEGLQDSGSPPLVEALLRHYEIPLNEIDLRHLSLPGACEALREGEVDAIVMTMGLKSVVFEDLVTEMPLRVVGIGQTIDPGSEIDGFRLTYPFVQATYVPKYAYSAPTLGRSGVPDKAEPAIGVRAVLVAHSGLPDLVANRIARTLVENKSSLTRSHPSAAQINEHFDPSQLQFPIHRGAHRYFHREDPGFLQRNAELMGFLLSLMIALTGFLLSARQWVNLRRKDRIDAYYIELDRLIDPLHNGDLDVAGLREVDEKLRRMQQKAIRQLAEEQLQADESFRIFQVLLNEGREEVRRRIGEKDHVDPARD